MILKQRTGILRQIYRIFLNPLKTRNFWIIFTIGFMLLLHGYLHQYSLPMKHYWIPGKGGPIYVIVSILRLCKLYRLTELWLLGGLNSEVVFLVSWSSDAEGLYDVHLTQCYKHSQDFWHIKSPADGVVIFACSTHKIMDLMTFYLKNKISILLITNSIEIDKKFINSLDTPDLRRLKILDIFTFCTIPILTDQFVDLNISKVHILMDPSDFPSHENEERNSQILLCYTAILETIVHSKFVVDSLIHKSTRHKKKDIQLRSREDNIPAEMCQLETKVSESDLMRSEMCDFYYDFSCNSDVFLKSMDLILAAYRSIYNINVKIVV